MDKKVQKSKLGFLKSPYWVIGWMIFLGASASDMYHQVWASNSPPETKVVITLAWLIVSFFVWPLLLGIELAR